MSEWGNSTVVTASLFIVATYFYRVDKGLTSKQDGGTAYNAFILPILLVRSRPLIAGADQWPTASDSHGQMDAAHYLRLRLTSMFLPASDEH